MRSSILTTVLLLPMVALAADHDTPAQKAIVALEARLNDALSRVDAKMISELWSDSFVFIAPNGKASNKSERLAGLPPASSSEDSVVSKLDNVSVRTYGSVAVAIVKTSWHGIADGKPFAAPFIATHVWVKEGKSWRLTSAQVAEVSTKPKNGGT